MTQVLQELDREWSELAPSPPARRALMRWAATYPVLAAYHDLDEVLAVRRDRTRSGPMLAALAALAPDDDIAARTLLQAMLPGIIRLSTRTGHDDPAAIDEMIALGWERIRTYPAARHGSVPANILLDVRKRYRRHRGIEAPTSIELAGEPQDRHCSTEDEVLGRLLVDELVDAQRRGMMTAPDLATILRTRLGDERLTDIAAEQQVTVRLLRHRRWRAEVRLRDLPLAG